MHIASMANDLTPGPLAPRARRPSSPESDILDYYDGSSSSSSCYSRGSSRTSIDSDPPGASTAADAYSIGSPVALGVFDEDQRRGWPADKNKPLPGEPPIALAPLQVRRPARSQQPSVKSSSTDRTASDVLRPSLAQAAADLENALDACATAANKAHHANHGDSPRAHGKVAENASSGPLQISRGAMLMRPSRPAPHPPADILPHSLQTLHPPCVPKKSRKMPFHLTVPGLGRRLHLRSLSGSNVRSEMEADRDHHHHGAHHHDRPSSLSNERELRRQLPRLQTKKVDVGVTGALAAMTATATATATTISLNHAGSHGSHSPRLRSSSATSSESLGGPVQPVETVQPVQPEPEPEPEPEPVDEKVFVACSKRRNNSYVLPYQPGSRPQIIYELDSMQTPPVAVDVHPSSPSSPARSVPRAASSRTVATWPAAMPDGAVRSVLEQAASLDDLFSLAVVNRQFYRLFQRHELDLIKHAVFQMSPPAWELREMSPPWDTEWQLLLDPDAQVPDYTPTLYLQRYAHDIFTLAQLKSLILARCCSFLRPDTINGLAGVDPERATAIDDAFWRVWTFCRIFGCGKGRETDIPGQMDWLNGGVQARSHQHQPLLSLSVTEPFGMNNVLFEPPPGFARGNLGGLSQSQMYDMTELFTCLSVLLQPIHGKCAEARAAGLYNGFDLKCGDHDKEEQMLEEWTAYLLTLGLSAVLSLGSICPIKDATTTFQKAKDMGLTKWDLSDAEVTRSSFLKEAVSKTYKSREDAVLAAASQQSLHSSAASTASSSRSSLAADSSDQQQQQQPPPFQENRVRQAAFAAELRKQRSQPGMSTSGTSFSDERPISSYTVVMDGLDGVSQPPPSPPPPIPHVQPTRWSAPVGSPVGGSVLDPVDRAIDMMVRELGFRDTEAKWALRTTDTGEGVDVNAAVNLLVREREASASAARGLGTISEEPLRWA